MSGLMDAGELPCTVSVESLNSLNGKVIRRGVYKNVSLVCCRDEFRDIILRILSKKSPLGKTYRLREIRVHKRFQQEGKATIKLVTQNIQLLLSNCPPSKLAIFLKCLSSKLAHTKESGFASTRTRIRSDLPRILEDISPLSEKDLTVSRKRPFGDVNDNGSTPKRCKRGEKIVAATRRKLDILSPLQSSLTSEQLEVIKAVRSSRNVFFTGSAGTGKTFLLRKLIGIIAPEGTFITASTGAAACHIGGTTLHAFAGIGSGSASLEQCIKLASRPQRLHIWKKCKCLIIDEISMVDAELFDKLEAVARSLKNNARPFGGIQLILSGDFLQLPPVSKIKGNPKKFCFQANSWQDCIDTTIELRSVFRQKDPLFVSILQNIRVGSCPEKLVTKLVETQNNLIEKDGILATKLCTHKENVDQINEIHMSEINAKTHTFTACDSDPGQTHVLSKQLPVPEKLDLKLGAQVMLVKNLNVAEGLVNGARGVVKAFEKQNTANPIIKFTCGIEKTITAEKWVVHLPGGGMVTRRQIPLKLAWAVSIHKSQGMTLDCVEMSLANVFEYGQAYVALSRACSLQSLKIMDFDKKCIRAHPEVLRYYGRLRQEQENISSI